MVYSIVSEFSKWLSNANESRTYRRKAKPFRLAWIGEDGKPQPGVGIELSPAGIVFATATHPKKKEVTVLATIREKRVPMRVVVQRETPYNRDGKPWFQFACKLSGISADDWDLLQREVSDEAEPENRAAAELGEVRKRDDDAYRTLPLQAQRNIITLLVNTKRLEPPAEGALPALRMQTLGRVQAPDGRALRRINIHSRRYIPDMDSTMAYDTQITIDDDGNVELLP
jgi:hypothetical protein